MGRLLGRLLTKAEYSEQVFQTQLTPGIIQDAHENADFQADPRGCQEWCDGAVEAARASDECLALGTTALQ